MVNKFNVNHNNKTNIIFKKGKKIVLLWLESGGVLYYTFYCDLFGLEKNIEICW